MGKRQWEKQRITVVYESPHGSGCDSHQSRPNVRQMDQAETHSRDQEGHQPELRREQREQPTQLGPIKCDGQPTMDFEPTMRWLSRRVWVQSLQKLLGGFLMLLGGIVLLATTWGFSYMVSLLALGSWIGYHHWFHSVFGLVVIPILFVGNARTSREYFSEYSVTTGTASGEVVNFYLPGVGLPSNVNPLAPDTMRAGVKMISDCLCVGPRVVTAAVRLFRKALRLRAAIAHHQKPAILSTPLRELPHLVRFLRSRAGAFANLRRIRRGAPTGSNVGRRKLFPVGRHRRDNHIMDAAETRCVSRSFLVELSHPETIQSRTRAVTEVSCMA
jgi:hypothetical protein